ncbi:hypothetical protein K7472_09370 [Streptomyces sp. PTM05]|uniref:Integral membrane protein n=1 Tax=Streptantibioticus parmotrematis TaxID=2873249 RepID=A0ABS7QPF2_9ACTN|nr:hypothetical protein [Streptantibioticus parmotrematis]MBY8885054.1 hypothetical protein [Streptantibioticus parmotrematis]
MTTPETTPEWPDPGHDRHHGTPAPRPHPQDPGPDPYGDGQWQRQPQYDAPYDTRWQQPQQPYADTSWPQQPQADASWPQQPQAGDAWQQPQPQAGYDEAGYDAYQAYDAPPASGHDPAAPAPAPAAGFGDAPAYDPAGGYGAHDPSYDTAAQPLPAPAYEPVPEPQAATPQAPSRRTGSPIIPPGVQPALLTVVLAALTAGAAGLARPALAVAAVLLQAVTAAGWFRLNGMWPARQGIMLAFLAGVTADVALLLAPADRAPAAILGTLGVWVLLILVQQMRHRGSADERLAGLTATAASTLLTVLAAGWVALDGTKGGAHPVIVGAVAVGAATLVRAVRLPASVSVAAALLVGGGAGAFAGHLLHMPASCAATALAAAVCALVGLRVASYDWPSRFVHFTAGVALPLALAAPVVYAVGHALA